MRDSTARSRIGKLLFGKRLMGTWTIGARVIGQWLSGMRALGAWVIGTWAIGKRVIDGFPIRVWLSRARQQAVLAVLIPALALAQSPKYGVGRAPTPDEIRALDISVAPDGTGLPPGSGTAAQGKDVYARRCQRCHGATGEGGDSVALAGGQGTLATPKALKTVGSFWPHATTLWDYTNRAMPFKEPGLLTHDQVYAVVAYVLHLNGIIGANEVMDAKTLPQVKMPNRNGFVPDARPDAGKKAKRPARPPA